MATRAPAPLFVAVAFLASVAAGAHSQQLCPSAQGEPKIGCAKSAAKTANYKYVYGDDVCYRDENDLGKLAPAQRSPADLCELLDVQRGTNTTKFIILAGGYKKLLKAVEDARQDKQVGAGSSSAGTTTAADKGVVSRILGFAVETGALSRSDSGSDATFRGNLLAIGRLIGGAEQLPYCAVYDLGCEPPLVHALEGASFSISYNTSQAGSTTSTSTPSSANNTLLAGASPKLSSWSARYDLNVHKPLSKSDFGEFEKEVNTAAGGNEYLAAVGKFTDLRSQQEYVDWWNDSVRALRSESASGEAGLGMVLSQAAAKLVEIAKRKVPDFDTSLDKAATAMANYFVSRDKALNALVNRITYSFEYDNSRPLNQPAESSVKLIVSARPDAAGKVQLSFNSTATWYDHVPAQAGVKRFRDAQASLQLDRKLTGPTARVGTSFSAAYYFQYMADNALLTIPSGNLAPGTSIPLPGNASVLLNTKGTISLGQVAVTFSFGNGVKLPVALSFSNRTDLLQASKVRGHFGITYDLDSLFAGLGGK